MDIDPGWTLEGLFEVCVGLESTARAEVVARVAEREPGLARELRSLLAAHAEDPGFLVSRAPRVAPELSRLLRALSSPARREPDGQGELRESLASLFETMTERANPAGRYALSGELGRGGMGLVLRARDPDLERDIAFKRLPLEGVNALGRDNPADVVRSLGLFLKEARVTAALDHPGVVPVHELGVDDGGHVYFTMRLVRGRELGEVFELARAGRESWSLPRALEVLLKVCDALAYAHEHGVVHRDLKPQNVLVGRFGEVYVMDWGVARVAGVGELHDLRPRESARGGSAPLETADGTVIGTPAYMSPEQARGHVERIDARSDVYAIGATLYELLSGHPPYVLPGEHVSAREILARVRHGAPASLHEQALRPPLELAAICEKAMAREPAERYASVQELAAELRAFLDGRVVRSYETGAWAEMRKWVRRNRGTAAAAAAALAILLAGLASTAWVQSRARAQATSTSNELARLNEDLSDNNALLVEERARAERSARDANRERHAANIVVEFLVELFRAPEPARAQGAVLTAREVLDRGAARIADMGHVDGLLHARLMDAMGRAYQGLDEYERAEELLTLAFAQRHAHAGPRAHETCRAASRLALLRAERGELQSAAELLEQTLAVTREAYGMDDDLTLDMLGTLATVRSGQSRYDEALSLCSLALAGRCRIAGAQDPEALGLRLTLGVLLRDTGCFEEARDELEEVVRVGRDVFGEGSPSLLRARAGLGTVLGQLAEWEQAETLLFDSWMQAERTYGPEHSDALSKLGFMAGILMLRGRVEEALVLHSLALDGQERVLGPLHPTTLGSRIDVAQCLLDLGRTDEGVGELWHVVENAERELGEDNRVTLMALGILALATSDAGMPEEAEEHFLEALDRHRRVLGPDHPQTLSLLHNYGFHLERLGRHEDAAAHLREAWEHERRRDSGHPNKRLTRDRLLGALVHLERWEEALPLVLERLEHTPAGDPARRSDEMLLARIASARATAAPAPSATDER